MATTATRKIGIIGLGNMGLSMAENLYKAGFSLVVHDPDTVQVDKLMRQATSSRLIVPLESLSKMSDHTDTVISVLPNDKVLQSVVSTLALAPGALHIGCSTVSPETARDVETTHQLQGVDYVSAPIFARPEGMRLMEANFVLSGKDAACEKSIELLRHTAAGLQSFGTEVGAANVVKLCGNFLIGSAIEAMAEALALAESQGINRVDAMKFYSSTFLASPIYKGYGQRVSERDHGANSGFALNLGLKDMTLVKELAHKAVVPMPVLSVLVDTFLRAKAAGRGDLDWSAIGLGASEAAGWKAPKTN